MNTYSLINTREDINIRKKWTLKSMIPRQLYLYYIQKKMPITLVEIEYLGERGQEVILPFSQKELESLDEYYIKSFLEKMTEQNEIEHLYVPAHLRKLLYKNEEVITPFYISILRYIMFTEIFERILADNKIDKKSMRLVIIDSGDRKIEYILELIISELNYLTIITKRPEYFSEFVDIIYDNTGLLVELIRDAETQEMQGSVIIDLSNDYHKCYRNNAVVLDMESSLIKRQYLYSRIKDIKLVYDTIFYWNNQRVDNELLGFLLLCNHQIIREFLENKNRDYLNKGLTETGSILNLKVDKLIYL